MGARLTFLAARYAFKELELVACGHEDAGRRLASRDAQHKLAHALEFAHQRHIIAVAGNDAEGIDQRVRVGDGQRVDDQLDISVVLLGDAVAQAGHDGEGVRKQRLLQRAEAVRIAVDHAQQDVAADLDLLQHALKRLHLRAAVLQVNEYCKFCHGVISFPVADESGGFLRCI